MSSANFENSEFSNNPYRPIKVISESEGPQVSLEIDEQARALRSLGNWQTCFAVVGFLGTGLILLMGLFQAIFMLRGGRGGVMSGVVASGMLLLMGFFCYLLPSILVLRAAMSARAVENSGPAKMTQFLKAQSAFWRYCGILLVVVFVVYFGFFVMLFLFGLSGVSF